MKITKFYPAITGLTFVAGVLVTFLWTAKFIDQQSFVIKAEENKFRTISKFDNHVSNSSEQIEKRIETFRQTFSIVEGDYNSQQNRNLWMYMYSTKNQEKSVVEGDLMVGSKSYGIEKNSYFDTEMGTLSFSTEQIGKVFYKFSGKISKKDYKDDEMVLEGEIEKIKDGKSVSVRKHEFKFYYHICGG